MRLPCKRREIPKDTKLNREKQEWGRKKWYVISISI